MKVVVLDSLAGAVELRPSQNGRYVAGVTFPEVGGSPGIVVCDRKTDQVVWRGHGWLAGQPDERGAIFYLSIQDSGSVYQWCLHGSTQTDFKIKLNLPEWVNQRRAPEVVDLSATRDALVLGFNDYPEKRSWLAALDVKNGQPHWQVERDSRLERWCLCCINRSQL